MSAKPNAEFKRRQILGDYTQAVKSIELAEAAINILEQVDGAGAVIKRIYALQHRQLKRLDKAAAKLGAPYPTKEQP